MCVAVVAQGFGVSQAYSPDKMQFPPGARPIVQLLVIARRFRCDAVLCGAANLSRSASPKGYWLHRRDTRRGWTLSSITSSGAWRSTGDRLRKAADASSE